jgi:pimeloyl-ACP methyl ester carboxylesterase
MKSFFFGAGRRLYGTLHEARGSAKSTGVLLCYPGVQEYNITHWAFRKLAGLLSRDGLPTMRFDYSSTGDSEGEVEEASLDHHVEDIAAAADELMDQTGVRKFSLVGMRLGALLAAAAVARGLRACELVLWEPVLRGTDYIGELERLDTDVSTRRLHDVHEPRMELAGYPFPSSMRLALNALELKAFVPKGVGRVCLFLCGASPEATEVELLWRRAGLKVSAQVVSEKGPSVTAGSSEGDAALLYTETLAAMARELTFAKAEAA